MFEALPTLLLEFEAPVEPTLVRALASRAAAISGRESYVHEESLYFSLKEGAAAVSVRGRPPWFGLGLGDTHRARIPPIRGADRWLSLSVDGTGSAHGGSLPHETTREFLAIGEALAVGGGAISAIGDVSYGLQRSAPPDPHLRAWPVMFLSATEVERIARERVESAPVRVRWVEGGGAWLEAGDEPFRASRRAVRALAEHLGRRAPL